MAVVQEIGVGEVASRRSQSDEDAVSGVGCLAGSIDGGRVR